SGGRNPAEQHPIPIHPLGAPWPPRSIQGKMLIAISESRRPQRNSVRYPVNAGLIVWCAFRSSSVLPFAVSVVIYRQSTSGVAVTLPFTARETSRPDGGFDYGVGPPGSRTVNTEPLPGSLATVTSPPIMRASLRVMARPRPVPP